MVLITIVTGLINKLITGGAHIVYIHINMYAQATQLDLQRQDMQILWQLVKCAATFSFMFNSVWFGVVFFTVL